MTKSKAPHAERLAVAEHLRDLLQPACERIEIAGSLRRKKPMVGDVELVVIPRLIMGHDMLGAPYVEGSELETLLATWTCPKPKNGPMYKQLRIDETQIDLFICEPATWPVTLLIRTGSAEFSQKFVTQRRQGGLLPAGYRVKDWRLQYNQVPQEDITEEEHLFTALGMSWVPPEERD